MAQRLKAWLYRLLGRRWYLYLVSQLFFLCYRTGLLRGNPAYDCHYYVRRFVEEGDWIIDIGANLGYYTVLFAGWTGTTGKVYSVEPVPLYREILRWNARSYPQVEAVPYALGTEPETVPMGIPSSANPYRHGLTQILSTEEQAGQFEVEVRTPDVLFDHLPRLDYVKCDVEGHEGEVLPAMKSILREHRPIVQVELAPENRLRVYRMMDQLGYDAFYVDGDTLVEITSAEAETHGDWIFHPDS